MSVRRERNAFGLMMDTASAGPVVIEEHGRAVMMVSSMEEYEGLFEHKEAGRNIVKRAEGASRRDQ
jgi:hypothetical protein